MYYIFFAFPIVFFLAREMHLRNLHFKNIIYSSAPPRANHKPAKESQRIVRYKYIYLTASYIFVSFAGRGAGVQRCH